MAVSVLRTQKCGAKTLADRPTTAEQLTKNGVACLTAFPLVDSVLAYYEIDMARGESGAVLQHFNPLTEQHAIISQCRAWIADGHPEFGAIEQVVWERTLGERTQANVLRHFARDVELLSLVAGPLNRLGALGSPDEAATYAGLSVLLLGKSEVPVRWQVGPLDDQPEAQLVLVAERGIVTVALEQVNAASQAIRRFVTSLQAGDGNASTWPDALRAMELTDTIEIALRRGRMIEVHEQQLTEDLAFKGTMSALGCGVLLLLPPLLLLGGWLAELLGLPVAVTKAWPYGLLALLAVFLGLQLIPKLLFDAKSDAKSDTTRND